MGARTAESAFEGVAGYMYHGPNQIEGGESQIMASRVVVAGTERSREWYSPPVPSRGRWEIFSVDLSTSSSRSPTSDGPWKEARI